MSNTTENNKIQLRTAFEAGQEFGAECFCGECDYCLLFEGEKAPDFERWYNIQLKSQPELLGEATELNPEMDIMEQAERFANVYYDDHERLKQFTPDWLDGLEVGAENGFIAGFNAVKAKERQAVIKLIEREIQILEAKKHIYQYTISVLKSLLGQIKSLSTKK